jgi:hypothetical protein
VSRHAPLVKELADRLRGMDVTSVVYFHTDHFEPWRAVHAAAVGPEIVDTIHDFCRATERIDFARRLTLFYKPHLNYALRRGGELDRADPEDLVGFLPRTAHEERFGREAMQEVVTSSAHDIQLHIHHEYYTATKGHTDPEAIKWFASPLGRSLDERRLELAIRLNREIITRESGRDLTRWFFVHGHWALNASDDSSCTITNEIDILLRNGCLGDFTFPAGRKHVNPRIKVPYLCRPFDESKGYDLPGAEPEIASGNAAAAATKFFIWASPANSLQCSLDYMSESSRRQIENTEKAARELIDNAYVADRRLFIKTHAHSVHPYYFEHARSPVFPHHFPATQTLLSVIFDAAAAAGLEIQFLTAPEVYELMIAAKTKPNIDITATYLQPGLLGTALARGRHIPAGRSDISKGRPVAAAAFAPARALELVRETAAGVLRQRIETLGIRGSGAYEHYSTMLRGGFSIPHYELMALDIVRRQVPNLSAYHEIGSGIGILPFLLALNGFPAAGIECDKRRHETARAIWRELSSRAKLNKLACQLFFGRFPAAATRCDTTGAIAILTDFITTQTAEQLRAIFDGLRRYRYVLVDLQRFCVSRDGADTQRELLAEFRAHGFAPIGLPTRGTDSAFVLLRNETVAKVVQKPALWSRLILPWRRGRVNRAALR